MGDYVESDEWYGHVIWRWLTLAVDWHWKGDEEAADRCLQIAEDFRKKRKRAMKQREGA
jgi:hypothetical protein